MGMMSKKQNVQNWDIRCITIKIGSCDYTNINIYVKELTDVCLFEEEGDGEGGGQKESRIFAHVLQRSSYWPCLINQCCI